MKSIVLSLPIFFSFTAYQNCAKSPERSTSLTINGADVYNSYGTSSGSGSSSGSSSSGSNFVQIRFRDASISYGADGAETIRYVSRKISGAGANAKLCLFMYSELNTQCKNEEDFQNISSLSDWTYDSNTDTFSLSKDFSSYNLIHAKYGYWIVASNGYRQLFTFKPIYFKDASIDNGTYATKFDQKIIGVGAQGLYGCATPIQNRATSCQNNSEFTPIGLNSSTGWKYSKDSDTYSIVDSNILSSKYPAGQYITRLIHPNGLTTEYIFTPTTILPPPTPTPSPTPAPGP